MDLQRTDCMVVMGSNFAENHPVGFRFVLKAQQQGAKLIHIDPRFTRTSALADLYAPIRAGSDIVFLGALINYVLQNEKYFKEYVLSYTNAATLIKPEFQGHNVDEDGFFTGWNAQRRSYETSSWQYQQEPTGGQQGQPANQADTVSLTSGFAQRSGQLIGGALLTDPTLQDPNCVFQILKRHYARYTPELVEEVCGTPQATFLQVAETLTANSGPERTAAFAYAVAWTQHTTGVQMIRTASILQLLLGNIGRPGGGIMALRGHATIQGSTDIPTLYNILPGYLNMPNTLRSHDTLLDYLVQETPPTGFFSNMPKYVVSLMKAWYGAAARYEENDYAFKYFPRISGDHSHMPMFVDMYEGRLKGFFAMGQNPAVGGQNAGMQREALAKLDWLVVKDLFLTETAQFWQHAPEVTSGKLKTADIKTEVFFFPAAAVLEMDGSYTNTMRLVQWHDKAADPPGAARSDLHFTYHLGDRLKKLYAGSTEPKDWLIQNMTWDYLEDNPEHKAEFTIPDEPSADAIMREINGYRLGQDGRPARLPDGKLDLVSGFGDLKDDGTTACGAWIYSGIYVVRDGQYLNRAAGRKGDEYASLGWGFAWPANRRALYNRASAKPDGSPWSERKKLVWWDAGARQWTGYDIPDFIANKPPDAKADWAKGGMAAHSGTDPFIMKADGKGWLFAPQGLVDGPLPAHYEPYESPQQNRVYRQHVNPVTKVWNGKRADGQAYNPYGTDGDPLKAAVVDPATYPYPATTYRLTEHHLSGAMSRWLPWLAELQPEMFIELSPQLARELNIANTELVVVESPRGRIECKALVTPRLQPLNLGGKIVHQVGMPIHWGYEGLVTGASCNDLAALVADPNVSIHEGKAFVVNVRKK
jgi:formate dehydrogenase major subunit